MKKCQIFIHNSENLPHEATVSKAFSRRPIKNLLLTKVAHCSGDEKKYIQHDHRSNIGLWNHKKLKKKNSKTVQLSAEIIGFKF